MPPKAPIVMKGPECVEKGVSCPGSPVPVLAPSHETRHEGPHHSVVVVKWIVELALRRQETSSPTGGDGVPGEVGEGALRFVIVQETEGEGGAWPGRQVVVGIPSLEDTEGVVSLLGPPVPTVQRLLGMGRESFGFRGERGGAQSPGHLRRALEGGDPDRCEVDVLMDPFPQPPDFDGSQPSGGVFDDPVPVRFYRQAPPIGSLEGRPELPEEGLVAAGPPVVPEGQHPVGSGVGVVVGIGEVLKPGDSPGGLADLVGDFPVFPLVSSQETESLSYSLPLAGSVHGQCVDGRVPPEEPSEAGSEAGPGGPPTRHKPAPQIRVADSLLCQVDLGPLQDTRRPGPIRRATGSRAGGWFRRAPFSPFSFEMKGAPTDIGGPCHDFLG